MSAPAFDRTPTAALPHWAPRHALGYRLRKADPSPVAYLTADSVVTIRTAPARDGSGVALLDVAFGIRGATTGAVTIAKRSRAYQPGRANEAARRLSDDAFRLLKRELQRRPGLLESLVAVDSPF